MEVVSHDADLVIVGAGYAGVNAFNAAAHHLAPGAKVVVIAREPAWGGQWVDQYGFVRLHQPHKNFTAGEREWDLEKPASYLPSKTEILRHFEVIVGACIEEKQLDVVTLFEYNYVSHTVLSGGAAVEVLAHPLARNSALPTMRVRASRLIRAEGANISIKHPMQFTAPAPLVQSMVPKDVLTPEWNLKMRFSTHGKDAPIWVVGSGKTAMDVINQLGRRLPGAAARIRCISGRGTYFMSRDRFNPTMDLCSEEEAIAAMANENTPMDYFREMLTLYDGTNALAVYREMHKRELFISAIPDSETFVAGISSKAEIDYVTDVLTPASEKIIKGHIVDVEVDAGAPVLVIRDLRGRTLRRRTQAGAFIINCTDHLSDLGQNVSPVLDPSGLVCSPQLSCGFPGPSANLITHLFYLGRLEEMWRTLPHTTVGDKSKIGIELMLIVVIVPTLARRYLGAEHHNDWDSPANFEMPAEVAFPAIMRFKNQFGEMAAKLDFLGRYPEAPSADHHSAGSGAPRQTTYAAKL